MACSSTVTVAHSATAAASSPALIFQSRFQALAVAPSPFPVCPAPPCYRAHISLLLPPACALACSLLHFYSGAASAAAAAPPRPPRTLMPTLAPCPRSSCHAPSATVRYTNAAPLPSCSPLAVQPQAVQLGAQPRLHARQDHPLRRLLQRREPGLPLTRHHQGVVLCWCSGSF